MPARESGPQPDSVIQPEIQIHADTIVGMRPILPSLSDLISVAADYATGCNTAIISEHGAPTFFPYLFFAQQHD
jgi:hypothetical protein